jgi:tetratricopeptide (TPR) repeat protein
MRLMGSCYSKLGNYNEAINWFRRACFEDSTVRETWCDLAQFCYSRSNWAECYFAATTAISITKPHQFYTHEPKAWSEKPYDLASIAAWNLGMKVEALRLGKIAAEMNPTDNRLRQNVKLMEESK